MENTYILIGILGSLSVVLAVAAFVYRKKSLELNGKFEELNKQNGELAANLQYEKTQNAVLESEKRNLSEYKEKYELLIVKYEEKVKLLQSMETKLEEVEKNRKEKEELIAKLNEELEVLREENSKLLSQNESLKAKLAEYEKTINEKNEKLKISEEEIKKLREENSSLAVENRELKTKQEEMEKSFSEKLDILKKSEERLKESFENLANEILEKTNEKMTKTSKESLSQLLNPLQNQMKEFKEKIEFLSKDEAEKISALQNELKNLKELSYKLSTDAENLTKALKGESKTQGNWGELVLERVLELSGLEKGREYEREVSLNDDDNKRYRPDVIVHLPNNRDVIIDAKTSLNAYQEYIKTEDKSYIKAHIQAIKAHIDNLADKKYENLKGVNSLDFIFMFVPIENALMLALENEPGLFEYAFKKRVVLVSPTTLLVSLRAIESSWRFEKQAKNIEDIVKTAENLYDKVRGFTEDFEKIGKHLETAEKAFYSAKNKLTTGKGNVIRQIEMLKEKANIQPKKEISKELTDVAMIEVETIEKKEK
jgi:DNA recombination protein RmuC